ncbi:hypothetical protein CUMW_239660 [Citrus unshiu]|uniref:Leucine-rich repeat-containing N-terminal plant-type domain-containing protein n=1 Tax=Citrus unshiu TaxID=55188 RepID=A0A2H5QKU9_CITUN|nr:hypothetical protein CUMW_239660 [Citrus unshiu]
MSPSGASRPGRAGVQCIDEEREALLTFKQSLVDEHGVLSSWGREDDKRDCCKWRGVHCSNTTGHVKVLNLRTSDYEFARRKFLKGTISPALLKLHDLRHLDLSNNDFGGSPVPEFIGSLSKLRYLSLSCGGPLELPRKFRNHSELEYLNLENSCLFSVGSLEWLSRLSSLRHLDLSYINLTKSSDWFQVVAKLHSLKSLVLCSCALPPVNPSFIWHFNLSTSIETLDLSDNNLPSSSIYPWLFNLSRNILYLNLGSNSLRGSIPEAFQHMPLSPRFRLPFIPPFSGSGSPSWDSNCYIVGKRGSRVSFNGSGKSVTTAILWDRVPAFLGMSAGSVYTSGRLTSSSFWLFISPSLINPLSELCLHFPCLEYPLARSFLYHGRAISASSIQVLLLTSPLVVVGWVLCCSFLCPYTRIFSVFFWDSGMSNRKRKLIVDESDEEVGDSDLNLSIPTDFLHPSSSVGPSHGRDTLEYPRPLAVSPSPKLELVGNRGGLASGSGEDHSLGGVRVPEGVGDGQLHPNGWRVLSAMYVLWEMCGSEEPSLVEVKHLYQLRSSPKEAGWYYFMSSSAKRKPITGFPSSCKNWKNKFFFAGGSWCPAAHSLGGDIYLPTHFVTPGHSFFA